MNLKDTSVSRTKRTIVRKCHMCSQVLESEQELEKCLSCGKAFLPVNYFQKVHAKTTKEFQALFATVEELHEEDLIRGIYVLW